MSATLAVMEDTVLATATPVPYVPDFLTKAEADALFAFCQTLPHERQRNPRNSTFYRRVRYPNWGFPFADTPPEIKALVEKISAYAGKPIKRIGVGGYENEHDGMNFHQHRKDRDAFVADQSVYVLSLGAEREIGIREVGETGNGETFWAAHGSLYVLPHEYNTTHEHAVLESVKPCGLRIRIDALPSDDMNTALATVVQETCMTLGNPAEMTDDQLADAVIQAFAKIQDYIPYIIALKARFSDGDRDSENHLLTPIKGCYSWKEFCGSILNRSPEALRQALAAAKKPKTEAHVVTEAEFAEYEQENHGIRKLTEKLLADGLPESDVVSALVNMEHPQPMAEAAVRVVTGQSLVTEPPKVFPLDVAFTALSPLLGENAGCILNALPTALDWVKRNQPLTAYQIETLSAIVTALRQISKLTSDYHNKLGEVLGLVRP
jgi:hypothetical protein